MLSLAISLHSGWKSHSFDQATLKKLGSFTTSSHFRILSGHQTTGFFPRLTTERNFCLPTFLCPGFPGGILPTINWLAITHPEHKFLGGSLLFERYDLMISPSASVSDFEFFQRCANGGITNYQFSKKMSSLLTLLLLMKFSHFSSRGKRSYPFEVLLFSTRINCRSQSWVEKRRIYNALFSHEKDPDVHSVELLCNDTHE